jgi:hypothetical protein
VDLAEAVLAEGLTLGLLGLTPGAELTVEVRADAGGTPAGLRLASGSLALGAPGRALWARVAFGEAVLVPSGPLWVLVRAARGKAVWLAGAWEAGVEAAQVSADAEDVAILQGAEALCALHKGAGTPSGGSSGGGLRLVVGGTAAAPTPAAQGPVAFDAAAGLSEALGQAGAGDPATLALHFWADPGTLLTVYPPRVVYDL